MASDVSDKRAVRASRGDSRRLDSHRLCLLNLNNPCSVKTSETISHATFTVCQRAQVKTGQREASDESVLCSYDRPAENIVFS